ncbi:hypothetical protein AX15_007691 [Amanita polypyramis BW_CC]|nr:hypothetical protein AX15_007691 [Amanita polypyramis BW_CC]
MRGAFSNQLSLSFMPPNQNATSGDGLTPDITRLVEDGGNSRPLLMAYYPDWAADVLPPEKIDFSRLDWIDFAFAFPDQNFVLTWDDPVAAPDLLRRLVSLAHAEGKKVKISVGGWTGSKNFSPAVATPENRQSFAQNIVELCRVFELDGVDIDWEYPGHSGDAGNQVNAQDSTNFLLFLQLLRTLLPPSAKLSAAVVSEPFVDSRGRPMNDMTGFSEVLDWVLVMNYDVWGSSGRPGPNAPMYDACGNSSQPDASAAGAFKAWTASGFPASKVVLGLPTYGYVSKSSAAGLRTRSPSLRKHAKETLGDPVTVVNSDGGSEGQVLFRELVQQDVLVRDFDHQTGKVDYISSGGFERMWDQCSSTPYLRSALVDQIVTYDDPDSVGLKTKFARAVGMLGINFFDLHGDTPEWDLINAAAKALLA